MPKDYINKFNIILTSGRQLIEELSGGNQQKCIISKWLLSKPKVLILDEPTRGVDVGVKSEMYEIINKLAEEGYEVVSVTPVISGSSSNVGTGGWGFGFTDGVIILAKKIS